MINIIIEFGSHSVLKKFSACENLLSVIFFGLKMTQRQ